MSKECKRKKIHGCATLQNIKNDLCLKNDRLVDVANYLKKLGK